VGDSDDGYQIVEIGFDFSYYGETKTNVVISSNGLLAFDSASDEFANECIPSFGPPNAYVGLFWDDLDIGNVDTNLTPNDGKVFYQTLGSAPNRRFVVEYLGIPHIDDANSRFTFEAVLYEGNGHIQVQYKAMQDGATNFGTGRSATLGIEDNTATRGVEWYCGEGGMGGMFADNDGPVTSGLAILYAPATTTARILVLQSTCGSSTGRVIEALNGLGPAYAYVATFDEDAFRDELENEGPWDLIVMDEYSDAWDDDTVAAIGNYITGGGYAIICHWDWYEELTLAGLFEANYVSDYTAPQPIYRWATWHPVFNIPNVVPDFTSGAIDPCDRDGARFNAIGGGIALGGYTAAEQANEHAIILGNNNHTILNGEVFDTATGDSDVDGMEDIVELIQNEVMFLLGDVPQLVTSALLAEHGTATPAGYGTNSYVTGTVLTNEVTSPADEAAGSHYACTGYVGSGSVPLVGAGASVVVTLTEDSTLTWMWVFQHYLSLTGVNGTISGALQGWKDESFVYSLTPTPAGGFMFDHWETNGQLNAGSTVPLLVTMDEPKQVWAYFTALSVFTNVTSNTTTRFLSWVTNRQYGTLSGTLELCNNSDSTKPMSGPYWYAVQPTADVRLWTNFRSVGLLPDGKEYVDITTDINNALPGVGNGDLFLNPGECVTVSNIEFYFLRRVPVTGTVIAVWADPPGDAGAGYDDATADTDGDGIANAWEEAHGLNKNNPFDGAQDFDLDGVSSVEEFWADTDPRDGASYLRMKSLGRDVQGVRVEWVGGTIVSQYLMWVDALGEQWLCLYTNVPPTPQASFFEHHIQSPPKGFYRIRTGR